MSAATAGVGGRAAEADLDLVMGEARGGVVAREATQPEMAAADPLRHFVGPGADRWHGAVGGHVATPGQRLEQRLVRPGEAEPQRPRASRLQHVETYQIGAERRGDARIEDPAQAGDGGACTASGEGSKASIARLSRRHATSGSRMMPATVCDSSSMTGRGVPVETKNPFHPTKGVSNVKLSRIGVRVADELRQVARRKVARHGENGAVGPQTVTSAKSRCGSQLRACGRGVAMIAPAAQKNSVCASRAGLPPCR
jgi:hypothetical protein